LKVLWYYGNWVWRVLLKNRALLHIYVALVVNVLDMEFIVDIIMLLCSVK